MHATRTAPPQETTAPGIARRRVWQAPAVRSHSLLCLTFARLYLAPENFVLPPDTPGAILNGADLDATLGPLATAIDLPTIQRVKLDMTTNTLTVDYRPLTGPRGGAKPAGQVQIEFESYEMADEVFTKLWRRLSDRMKLHQDRPPTDDLIRVPLASMVGVLLATVLLIALALIWGDGGTPGVPVLDWRMIAGVGGATLAGLQVWLYRRWTTPPKVLELRTT